MELLFNTPIGYTKNPLVYGKEHSVSEPRYLPPPSLQDSNSMPPLDRLPAEIRARIANELSQLDCLNLMVTNRAMYELTVPRLYQHIIVDEDFTQFSKEYDYRFYKHDPDFGTVLTVACSYINSAYTFKKLLASYTRQAAAPPIHIFQVIKMPDSINTYDYELNDTLVSFFSRLDHLQELVWMNDNFRLRFLGVLPFMTSVTSLMLNIRYSNYLTELDPFSPPPEPTDLVDTSSINSGTALCLPGLVKFYIKPYQNSIKLVKIINNFLLSGGAHVADHLQFLELHRSDKELNSPVPPVQELIVADRMQLDELDTSTISALFARLRLTHLSNLHHLALSDCIVGEGDGDLLAASIDLSRVTFLKLLNVSEWRWRHQKGLLLEKIAPSLISLKALHLDYREVLVDTIADFLTTIPSSDMHSVDLTIRLNGTKPHPDSYDAHAHALGRWRGLRHVSLEIKEELAFCDFNIPVYHAAFYRALGRCKHLTSLRLNPGTSVGEKELVRLIAQLPKLRMLDVFGAKAGGAPHLGLGTNHPTIYDEWFKVQHVALIYARENLALQYIRVNRCVFECVGGVNPRDGIDRWFDQRVRV